MLWLNMKGLQLQVANGIQVSNMNALVNALSDAKQAYTDTITIDAWATARGLFTEHRKLVLLLLMVKILHYINTVVTRVLNT